MKKMDVVNKIAAHKTSILVCFSDPPKPPKSKDREKKGRIGDKDKPGLLLLLAMIVVFYICGSIVQWNFIIVFCLSIVFGIFLYWFGLQHEAV